MFQDLEMKEIKKTYRNWSKAEKVPINRFLSNWVKSGVNQRNTAKIDKSLLGQGRKCRKQADLVKREKRKK